MGKLEYRSGKTEDMIYDFIFKYERMFGSEKGHLIALYFLEPEKDGNIFGKLMISPLALKILGKKGIVSAMEYLAKDAAQGKELIKHNRKIH